LPSEILHRWVDFHNLTFRKKLSLKLTCFDRRESSNKNVQLMDFWKLFHYRLGFRFFSMARSNVISPRRISSAKGMTSGRIKSTTNTSAAKASNFGKRSRDAYRINRSWMIRLGVLSIFYFSSSSFLQALSESYLAITPDSWQSETGKN